MEKKDKLFEYAFYLFFYSLPLLEIKQKLH